MKILVVDDSIVFRSAIVSAIGTEQGLEVTRSLVNGKLALDFLQQGNDVDLITLDMEMPVMDGISTIKEIRKFNKDIIIIVFSSFTRKGAEKTIEALNAGANDFVTKPENLGTNIDDSINSIKEELLPKILCFKGHKKTLSNQVAIDKVATVKNTVTDLQLNLKPNLVVIGCSTGGPEALSAIFKKIQMNLNVPMLIVQHMPPIFTEKLAEMLSRISKVEVREAKNGDRLAPGLCLVAPGDFHMVVNKEGQVFLNQDEKVCFVRPSVDVLFASVAENFRGNVLSIILTGMGEDGAIGAKKLHDKGAVTFVQDKESSVVWGMPSAALRQVDSAKLIDINDVGTLIIQNCR